MCCPKGFHSVQSQHCVTVPETGHTTTCRSCPSLLTQYSHKQVENFKRFWKDKHQSFTLQTIRHKERLPVKRTTTSSDYIIRLTDRLQSLRTNCMRFFSHGSRAGTTTKRDTTTTRVAAAACNGTDYNNCDVSTTATSINYGFRYRIYYISRHRPTSYPYIHCS